jgi:hypothetical protein
VVEVHPPLVEFLPRERAEQLAAEGVFADDEAGLRAAWERVQEQWTDTVARARRLPEPALDERVDDEWSFLETLRHLVFVTDAWVGDVVQERPDPHHPWGLPPHFLADAAGALGLDVDARPRLDDLLALRAEQVERVRGVLARLTPEELHRTCAPRQGRFSVLGALQTTLFEEWAHHVYAARDLTRLEADSS